MDIAQEIKNVKRHFMAMRNGITADILRKAGLPYKVIFGLNLPQLSEISRSLIPSVELASALWNDVEVRESRLLAPMIMPRELEDTDIYVRMAHECRTKEECDILSFRLLRYVAQADDMARELAVSDEPLVRYCGEALMRNLEN